MRKRYVILCKFRFILKDAEIAHVDMNYQDCYNVPSLSTCNFLRELLSGSSNKEKQQYYGVVNVVTCVSFPATSFWQDPIVAGHNR